MPKIKTHKSLSKRVRISGAGAVIMRHANTAHRKRFKSTRAKQKSVQGQVIVSGIGKKISLLLK
jgi:ribosomal protein L35